MARATSNKLYRTFVKGLVTEASPLTYPEDTSYDELNTILSRKGSRTRRLGINYEADTITAAGEVTNGEEAQYSYVWKAVKNLPDVNFLVVQKGLRISFFDMSTNVSAESLKTFSIDLSDYLISGYSVVEAAKNVYQMTSGKGYLFITGISSNPIVVDYDPEDDDITVTNYNILIRDFDGLNDDLANDEEPATLTKEHHYNLMNQGWVYGSVSETTFAPTAFDGYVLEPSSGWWKPTGGQGTSYSTATPSSSPLFQFYNEIGRYPGNNKQWWVARAEADDPDTGIEAGQFLPKVLDRLYSGNNRAPNGHFILDAFHKDRSAISGISNIEVEALDYRPEAVTFFSGRAWYGAGSTVYFSQIIDSTGVHKAAMCYQEADPTAEDISDLIASDGGVVPIPEANRIRRLIPMGNGVLVIAQNGVWFVSGGDSAFSAINIAVGKISSLGTKSPLAAIEVDETLFWWNETGIQALQQASGQFGPVPGKFGNTSISEQTIQSLFNAIDEGSKKYVKSEYDPRNNRIIWLFNDRYEEHYFYNKALIFDLTLQAFFLWEFAEIEGGPAVMSVYNNIEESFSYEDQNVLEEGGDQVVSESLDEVVSQSRSSIYSPSSIQFLVNVPGEGRGIAALVDTAYVDWASFDGTGQTFNSYVETGYELMGDSMREKQAIYVFCHFKRETNSSCWMRAKWDWSNSSNSNRWSTQMQSYRERTRPSDSTTDLSAFEVVTTKNKVRGSGKAVQFRFGTDERGKNFELLGWAVAYVGNTQP